MYSKIDILGKPTTPTYKWEKYKTGKSKLYQWDAYLYEQNSSYWWTNYPTKVLDKDYNIYLKYDTQRLDSVFAQYDLVKPYSVAFKLTRRIDIGFFVTLYDVPYDTYLENRNNWLVLGEDISSLEDLELGEIAISEIEFKWNEEVIKSYTPFYPASGTVKVMNLDWVYNNLDVYGWDNNANEWKFITNETINPTDWDFEKVYLGIGFAQYLSYGGTSDTKLYSNMTDELYQNLVNSRDSQQFFNLLEDTMLYNYANTRSGMIDWIKSYTEQPYSDSYENARLKRLSGVFVKHKTLNKWALINDQLPQRTICFGRMPNTNFTIGVGTCIQEMGGDRKYRGLDSQCILFIEANLFDATDTDIQNGVYYDSNVPIGALSTKPNGYTQSTVQNYGYIGNVCGKIRLNTYSLVYGEGNYDDEITYQFEGTVPKDTLVPYITTFSYSFDTSYYPNTEKYRVYNFVFEDMPLFGIYFGYSDPNLKEQSEIIAPTRYRVYCRVGLRNEIMSYISNYLPNRGLSAIDTQYSVPYRVKDGFYMGEGEALIDDYSKHTEEDFLNILDFETRESQGFCVFNRADHRDPTITTKVTSVSSFDKYAYPNDGIKGGYYYKYIGSTTVTYGKIGTPTNVFHTNSKQYPKNGIATENGVTYWYVYKGINEQVIKSFTSRELLNNVNYTQSAGSNDAFSIGSVGGASISLSLWKPISEIYSYMDFPLNLYFTFAETTYPIKEGKFTIKEITENGLKKTDVVAYDNTIKLDCQFKPLGERLTYPISALRLFFSICAYCDIPYRVDYTFLNSDAIIENAFGDDNTTCREVMEWIAQIAGAIVIADADGYLVFKTMAQPEQSRGSNDFNTKILDVSMYPIQKPTAIQYKNNDETILVTNADTSAPYIIDYSENPFTLNTNRATVNYWLRNVLNSIDSLGDIYAYSVKVPTDVYEITCGDSWVVASSEVTPRRGIVNNKTIDSSGVNYVSSGTITSLNSAKALSGSEIDTILDDINGLFKEIRVDRFIIRDTILGEDIEVINDPYIFNLDNTSYSNEDLAFDISSQFEGLYNGEEVELILQNGDRVLAQVVNHEFIIKDPRYVPSNLTELDGVILYDMNDNVLFHAPKENIDYYHEDSTSGRIDLWDDDDYYAIGLGQFTTTPNYSKLTTQLSKFLFRLSDGLVHNFPLLDGSSSAFEEADSTDEGIILLENKPYDTSGLRIKYNVNQKLLEIWFVPNVLDHNITINSITATGYTLTNTLPLTITSGTPYVSAPVFELTNSDGDKIEVFFDGNWNLTQTSENRDNKVRYGSIVVNKNGNDYSLTFGNIFPVVKNVVIMYGRGGGSGTEYSIRNGRINTVVYNNFAFTPDEYPLFIWETSYKNMASFLFMPSKDNYYETITYNKNNRTFTVWASTIADYLDSNRYSYDWSTQTFTINDTF